jgi:hypothetical protein
VAATWAAAKIIAVTTTACVPPITSEKGRRKIPRNHSSSMTALREANTRIQGAAGSSAAELIPDARARPVMNDGADHK